MQAYRSRRNLGHHLEQGTKKSRYVTVLHIPPVDSPLKAVRAAIVSEMQE